MKIKIMFILLITLALSGCGYHIKYELNEEEFVMPKATLPLNVQVAKFSDKRPPEEREKLARKEKGAKDLGDYTYDREFRGEVAEEVSKMLVEHLNYSKVFKEVTPASFTSEDISDAKLDSLREMGVDAVMVGEITHFYGYYDQSIGRTLLYSVPLATAGALLLNYSWSSGYTQYTIYWYGPGLVLGYYLESLHKRNIEYSTQLVVKMISTSTHKVLWEDTFEISEKLHGSMPGLSQQRKFQVTIKSLRDAINKMLESLSKIKDNELDVANR